LQESSVDHSHQYRAIDGPGVSSLIIARLQVTVLGRQLPDIVVRTPRSAPAGLHSSPLAGPLLPPAA